MINLRFRTPVFFGLLVALIFSLTLSASAQRYLGSIQGEVTDPSGAKVVGAGVVAEETTTHYKTEGKTNESGAYTFAALNPGTYTITVTAGGFRPENVSNVILTAGQAQNVDLKLTVGATNETVEVVADTALLDTGSANIATTLSTQEVTDLPNNGRNPFVMATLAAGVSIRRRYFQGKASQFTNPFSGVAVQIATDGSGGHNRLTLDGIPDDPAGAVFRSQLYRICPVAGGGAGSQGSDVHLRRPGGSRQWHGHQHCSQVRDQQDPWRSCITPSRTRISMPTLRKNPTLNAASQQRSVEPDRLRGRWSGIDSQGV